MSSWRDELRSRFPHAKLDEPLARYTTFRIGGPADCYIELKTRAELPDFFKIIRDHKVPLFMLGWGSNLLIRDGGVRACVARLRGEFEKAEFLDGQRVRAGAGLRVPQFVSLCAERGLAGAEPLIGVPGTMGGAFVMNAGTRDGEVGPLVESVEFFDAEALRAREIDGKDLGFAYRRSNLEGRVVLGGILKLKAADKGDIMARIQNFQQRRLQTQPVHTHNVGSVFKNPSGRFVAQMIEEAGLKGRVLGGARVSPQHANFIENFSNASANDVLGLVDLIRGTIRSRFSLDLELEMKVVGEA